MFAVVFLIDWNRNVLVPTKWLKDVTPEELYNNGWKRSDPYTIFLSPLNASAEPDFSAPIRRMKFKGEEIKYAGCFMANILACFSADDSASAKKQGIDFLEKRRNVVPKFYGDPSAAPVQHLHKIQEKVDKLDLNKVVKLESEIGPLRNQVSSLMKNYADSVVVDMTAGNLRILQEEMESNALDDFEEDDKDGSGNDDQAGQINEAQGDEVFTHNSVQNSSATIPLAELSINSSLDMAAGNQMDMREEGGNNSPGISISFGEIEWNENVTSPNGRNGNEYEHQTTTIAGQTDRTEKEEESTENCNGIAELFTENPLETFGNKSNEIIESELQNSKKNCCVI